MLLCEPNNRTILEMISLNHCSDEWSTLEHGVQRDQPSLQLRKLTATKNILAQKCLWQACVTLFMHHAAHTTQYYISYI